MSFVVVATWTANAGEEDAVLNALTRLAASTRQEPGCKAYEISRGVDDPRVFTIYEVYDSRAAFDEHAGSDHFRTHALEDGIPRLESRSRFFGSIVD